MKLVCIPAFNESLNITRIINDSKKYAEKDILCDYGSTHNTKQ